MKLQNPPENRHDTVLPLPLEVKANAWAVDAGCSGNPGAMEYQGVDLATGEQLDKCINAFIKVGKELGVLK